MDWLVRCVCGGGVEMEGGRGVWVRGGGGGGLSKECDLNF